MCSWLRSNPSWQTRWVCTHWSGCERQCFPSLSLTTSHPTTPVLSLWLDPRLLKALVSGPVTLGYQAVPEQWDERWCIMSSCPNLTAAGITSIKRRLKWAAVIKSSRTRAYLCVYYIKYAYCLIFAQECSVKPDIWNNSFLLLFYLERFIETFNNNNKNSKFACFFIIIFLHGNDTIMIMKKMQLVLEEKNMSVVFWAKKNSDADMQDEILIAFNGNKQYKTYIKCT